MHQRRYQLSRHKPVHQGCLCLMVSELVLWVFLRRRRQGNKLANQHRNLLRRHKPVNPALRAKSKQVRSPGLLRRQMGDKLANQHLYLLKIHKPVNQLLFGLRASMHGLWCFGGGEGETCTCTNDATS